ncbi:MAG: hypothetical protein LH632_00585 [Rhodoferax sp.]|nr:hypothetical protein [Rhodoferax sp.]
MRGPIISLLAAAAIGFACSSHASSHSAAECREGADFIRNAAMARNNGQPREAFLERLHGDLAMIRSMPRALRWFARDKADELLLIGHVERVYDVPVDPRLHEAAFMADCRKTIETIPAGQTI